MEVSMFNSEGYRDPTPHDAISKRRTQRTP